MIKPASDFVAEAKAQCDCLTAEAALQLLESTDDLLIIDVREPHEAAEKCLSNAINIPRGVLEMKISQHCADPTTTILVHCAAGGRASLAAARLQEMGYQKVHPITEKFDDIASCFSC